jgi:hypothetical protein
VARQIVIEQHNLDGIVVSQESSQQIDFVPRAVGLEEPLRWIFEWEKNVVEVDIDAGFKASSTLKTWKFTSLPALLTWVESINRKSPASSSSIIERSISCAALSTMR